jgi:hypothetical protein
MKCLKLQNTFELVKKRVCLLNNFFPLKMNKNTNIYIERARERESSLSVSKMY